MSKTKRPFWDEVNISSDGDIDEVSHAECEHRYWMLYDLHSTFRDNVYLFGFLSVAIPIGTIVSHLFGWADDEKVVRHLLLPAGATVSFLAICMYSLIWSLRFKWRSKQVDEKQEALESSTT